MPPLPIRPWIFVLANLAFIATFFGAALTEAAPVIRYALAPMQVGVASLQVVWIWQALRFATAHLRLRGAAERASLSLKVAVAVTVCLVVGLTPFAIYLLVTGPFPDSETIPTVVGISMPLGIVGMFGLFWIAGRALGDAERANGARRPNDLGIAIQFAYLLFTAPALYRRLRALERPAQDGAPNPAYSAPVLEASEP